MSASGGRYSLRRGRNDLPPFRERAGVSSSGAHHQNRFVNSNLDRNRSNNNTNNNRRPQRKSSPYESGHRMPDRRPNKVPKRRRFQRYRPYGRTRPTRDSPWDGEKTPQQTGLNLDQEQEKRASWAKRKMQQDGKPPAPFNTTQFLMEDHKVRDPVVPKAKGVKDTDEMDILDIIDFCASPNNEDFQARQFSEAYENVHAERLSSMTKAELIQEYLLLETKADDLERKLRDVQGRVSSETDDTEDSSEVTKLRDEVEKLRKENQQLRSGTRRKPKSAPSSPARVSFSLNVTDVDKDGDG